MFPNQINYSIGEPLQYFNSKRGYFLSGRFAEIDPSTGGTKILTPMSNKRQWCCGTVHDKKISVAGGSEEMEVYDFQTNTWQDRIKIEISKNLEFFSMASHEGFIYVAGGRDCVWGVYEYLTSFQRYSIETKEWATLEPMKKFRENFTLLPFKKYLYALGGVDRSVQRYDPEKNIWEYVAETNSTHKSPGAVVFNDKMFIFSSGILEIYDIENNFWIKCHSVFPEATQKRYRLICLDNKLLAMEAEGFLSRKEKVLLKAFQFDFYSYEWKNAPKFTIPLFGHHTYVFDL